MRFLLTLFTLVISCLASAQSDDHLQDEFNLHYNKAVVYNELSMFGSCIEELELTIGFAAKHQLEEQRMNAVILLAEIMRKTNDYDKGLELLRSLQGTQTYPRLHVRKLGRIAAIYNERPKIDGINQKDSVLHYLHIALDLATKLNLLQEEASLYNELGYTISGEDRQTGLTYLLRSAKLFDSLNDKHNYVGAMTNVLRSYLAIQDTVKSNAVIQELLPLVKDQKWYTAEIELYELVSSYYFNLLNDSLTAQQWHIKADKSRISNLTAINSSQVNAFRTLYETKKIQEALDRQKARSYELIIYLSILAVFIIGIIALLLRERKLKKSVESINLQLKSSNQRYQLLMIESNHRIKNNLQMIISMLRYSVVNENSNSNALERMADKIQTISGLHQHLSIDIHNELVGLDAYFSGIVARYEKISPAFPSIQYDVESVVIRSERIVYFGLILNEMFANTLEHRISQENIILLSVKKSGEYYQFNYSDGSRHASDAKKGMGSTLIYQLTQHVGGFEFQFDNINGHYQFKFHG